MSMNIAVKRFQHEHRLEAVGGSQIRTDRLKHLRPIHNIAYFEIKRIFVSMEGVPVNDKYVAFLNVEGFGIDNMRSVSIQHNHELGEFKMLVESSILIVSTVLNKERKLLIVGKPIQVDDIQDFDLHLFFYDTPRRSDSSLYQSGSDLNFNYYRKDFNDYTCR